MGTRSVIAVIDKVGDLKISQYGQFDGYASGLGIELLILLKQESFISKLEEKLNTLIFLGREENFTEYSLANFISRDLKSKVLENIVNSKDDKIGLIEENLDEIWTKHIQYLYTINYQRGTLNVEFSNGCSKSGYDITLKTFDLYDLPTEKDFLDSLPKV